MEQSLMATPCFLSSINFGTPGHFGLLYSGQKQNSQLKLRGSALS